MKDFPRLVLSDKRGRIYVHPNLLMLGSSSGIARLPSVNELIPLPKGSTLFYMPEHIASGYDLQNHCEVFVGEYANKKVFPISAFLIPGYTRLLLPSSLKSSKKLVLPLWPYASVGWANGKFWVSAIQIDSKTRQRPHYYSDTALLKRNVKGTLKKYTRNRLFKHLAHCALNYNCRAAQNLFFRRWEAPLPTSPSCNSRCLGCLSLQDSDCVVASHQRIDFVPTPKEIEEVSVYHLDFVKEAIVSFGQGCEGEPLLQFQALKESIIRIRRITSRGTIHLNTNAYSPNRLKELAKFGLNSVRVSLNSLRKQYYDAYYRPKGYKFTDVMNSVKVAKESGLFVSLNLLIFPGLSDTRSEIDRLVELIKKHNVDLLQLRNLSIDPDFYLSNIPPIKEKPLGIVKMINLIKKSAPRIRFGYFNIPKEEF